MRQDELFRDTDWDNGQKILSTIENVVGRIGIKAFSASLNKDATHLRHAFNNNDKYFSVTWMASLIRQDTNAATELINLLCDLANKQHPLDKIEETPEEKLVKVNQIIKRHGLEPLFKEVAE